MKLFLEKTTGFLAPAGAPVAFPRAAVAVELTFLASGVAELVAGGAVSLKLYTPADLVTPVATFASWAEDAVNKKYTATLDVLTALGIGLPTYLARVEYGSGPTVAQWFHLNYGDAAYQAAIAATTISITVNTTGGGGAAQTGTVALGANVKSGTITFSPALGATPSRVDAYVEPPNGSGAVIAVTTHSRTASGCSFILAGRTPDTAHVLRWAAYL